MNSSSTDMSEGCWKKGSISPSLRRVFGSSSGT